MSCNYQTDLRCHVFVIAITLLAIGCGGVAQSPVAPSPTRPAVASPPPAASGPGPHFALELQAMNAATYEGDLWVGQVSVLVNPQIIRPELPARVVTTCGSETAIHALGSGSTRVSCLLPIGSHNIGAVAEMADGRRFPTAITARVLERPVQIVPLHYDVPLSSRHWTDVIFGTQTFTGAEYRWTFGDGETQTTLLNGTEHRYEHPGDEPSKERTASVLVVKGGKTLATGSVVGIW